jgi:hypothetical protein
VQLYIPPRNRIFGALDAMGVIGLCGLLAARFVPIARWVPFWGCGFRRVTGIPCPGCGLTRVADRFAHFHWVGAFKANPLGSLTAAFFAACVVGSALHLAFGMPLPELILDDKEWRRARWAAVLLFLANYAFVIYSFRVLGWT